MPRALPALQKLRVRGGVRVCFACDGTRTYAASSYEAGGWRVRFPDAPPQSCEAVILNTGGGVAGGDEVSLRFDAGPGARATVTAVAGERIYRTLDTPSRLTVELDLGAGSALALLPRETILSSVAQFRRRIDVDMAPDAKLMILDILVLGRRASGERMTEGLVDDRWTIMRHGRLAHLEVLRLQGAIEREMQRPAIGGGSHVVGTLLYVAADAQSRLEPVQNVLAGWQNLEIAASAWDGKLLVRGLAGSAELIRNGMAAAIHAIDGRTMPRAWST